MVDRLRELERERERLAEERSLLRPISRLAPQVVASQLEEWRRLLRGSMTPARAVLQRILRGRIAFRPLPGAEGYEFRCETRFDRLFAGVAVTLPKFIPQGDQTGTEHIRPENTSDWDYARVLERAQRRIHGKGMASPTGVCLSGPATCRAKSPPPAAPERLRSASESDPNRMMPGQHPWVPGDLSSVILWLAQN